MPSPPRRSRGSPRHALHERSESQTNERISPTLRLVEDSEVPIYGESPFPTKPSQILEPTRQYPHDPFYTDRPVAEQAPSHVSAIYSQEREPSKRNIPPALPPLPALSFSTSSTHSRPAVPAVTLRHELRSIRPLDPPSQEIQLPADDHDNTRPHSSSASPAEALFAGRQPSSKDSDTSLSSANSTGTVIVRKAKDGKKRASYSAFPYANRPGSSTSNLSTPSSQNPSPESSDRHISSTSASTGLPLEASTLAKIQYPVIRAPSASGSWAESSTRPLQIPGRSANRWNPHLSTVPSEGAGRMSLERSSQGTALADSLRASKSSNILSSLSNSDGPLDPDNGDPEYKIFAQDHAMVSPLQDPRHALPLPPPIHQRNATGSTIRVVSAEEDASSQTPSANPGWSDSADVRSSGMVNNRTSVVMTRPGSRASFFKNSIPAWAKAYYGRPASSNSASNRRASASSEAPSLSIARTRDRTELHPNHQNGVPQLHPTRSDESNTQAPGVAPRRRVSPTWSPHLWHDRNSLDRRRSVFLQPSMDEAAEGIGLTKRNVQIICFSLGFVFPLAWFIAAWLPLPAKPKPRPTKGKNVPRQSEIMADLEQQLSPVDVARYENARWWRHLNRLMCLCGVAVMIAIVSQKTFHLTSETSMLIFRSGCSRCRCSNLVMIVYEFSFNDAKIPSGYRFWWLWRFMWMIIWLTCHVIAIPMVNAVF